MISNGYKKAAAYLSQLRNIDQQWLLQELPKSASEKLRALIDDVAIHRKGIYGNNDSLNTFEIFANAKVEDVWAVLKDEPVPVICIVLFESKWTWEKKFLKKLDLNKRQRIIEYQKCQVFKKNKMHFTILDLIANELRLCANGKSKKYL